MPHFSKSLLTGFWILLLISGTGNTHQPAFLTESNQNLLSSPLTLSLLQQPPPRPRPATFTTQPEHVSITTLLNDGADFHQRLVAVRGLVTQPELHLDESELFINFVFRLAEGDQSVVVFGRHDRTQGAPSISLNLSVEVIGVFWKERDIDNAHITNTIEALTVSPYPPLVPDNA